jgi:putative ABC transport system ATP-binding protein
LTVTPRTDTTSARDSTPLVSLRGVSRIYGAQRALDRLDLDVARGEWLAVMGPSGSGKTTLLNLLGGLDRPDEGTILFDGRDVARLDENERARHRREDVGLVFQQFHLLPYLSALENVMIAQHFHSMADAAEARTALEKVGLGAKLDARPGRMSGGEQQRVCIARALINEPRLLLADEPTGNLDEANARVVLELFAKLHAAGHTIVLVTHDPDVGALADRRIELHHGRLAHAADASPHAADTSPHAADTSPRRDAGAGPDRHFLQEMWYLFEDGHPLSEADPRGVREGLERGWLRKSDDAVEFTPSGATRARDLVRRHRLAECLFATAVHPNGPSLDATACRLEPILDPTVTDGVCGLLRHPTVCPHGKPVPSGECCRAGETRS